MLLCSSCWHCDHFSTFLQICAAVSFVLSCFNCGEVNLSSVEFPEVPQDEPIKRVSGTVKVLFGYLQCSFLPNCGSLAVPLLFLSLFVRKYS